MSTTFVLLHSPLTGPATWQPVATALRRRGRDALVPALAGAVDDGPPYWPSVVARVREVAPPAPLVLVAHDTAGLFVPVLTEALDGRVAACLFVDAAVPARSGATPVVAEELLPFLRDLADEAGLLPHWLAWQDGPEAAPTLPDAGGRQVVAEERPRPPLAYYEQRIPAPARWDRVACGYLLFSQPYEDAAREAGRRGWPVDRLPGGHLHQLVAPGQVADWLIRAAE